MAADFDYFVIFAGMRTGSNFLEANINEYPGLNSIGEAFNPNFIGQAKKQEIFGMSMLDREADPLKMIRLMKEKSPGMPGFRFFFDHDPRVLESCLADSRCAKIILNRNPVETYVSREIARQTNQWRLRDAKHAKSAKAVFELEAFEAHLAKHAEFQQKLRKALQTSGQTAFYIGYEDISDVDVLNGLARFLGVEGTKKKVSKDTKKQNPQSLEEKVENFSEMEAALASADYFRLDSMPSFEPERGPAIPSYIAPPETPLLYMPVTSGPTAIVSRWLADLDGVSDTDLSRMFTQKSLRKWKRQSKGHQSFTVVRHPVVRLHEVFANSILFADNEEDVATRNTLRKVYNLPIPECDPADGYEVSTHRTAFIAFADFIKKNLSGQTGLNVDRAWASQSEIIKGMGQFIYPGHIFSEVALKEDLEYLAQKIGMNSPELKADVVTAPIQLIDIYDANVEVAVRAAYQRDYMMFGFGPWRA